VIRSHSAHFNGGCYKIFAADWAAGEAAHHGQLACVGKRIGDRALQEPLDGDVKRGVGG